MTRNFYIKKNIVTEKTSLLNNKGCYVFEIPNSVNKIELKKSIESYFKVNIKAINILNSLTKNARKYTNNGTIDKKVKIIKKAYVYLKDGEDIDFTKLSD